MDAPSFGESGVSPPRLVGCRVGVPAPKKPPHERIERLNHWLDKGQKILPWLVRFMKI